MSTTPFRRRISPPVPFTIQFEDEAGTHSKSLLLSYDLNAFALIEEQTGISMLTGGAALFTQPTVKNITVLLWAATQANSDEFAGKEGLVALRNLLSLNQLQKALEASIEAFVQQL